MARPQGRTIQKSEPEHVKPRSESDDKQVRHLKYMARASTFMTIPEQIAEHKEYEKNAIVPQLKARYPQDHEMFHIDALYPFAKGGPLYVDYADFPEDIIKCEEKAKILRAIGMRYLLMKPQITEADARKQLG